MKTIIEWVFVNSLECCFTESMGKILFRKMGVTMGDPAGVGPELMLKLVSRWTPEWSHVPVIFGEAGVLERIAPRLGLEQEYASLVHKTPDQLQDDLPGPVLVDLKSIDPRSFTPRQVNATCGKAAYAAINAAIDAAMIGTTDGLVTGPVNKESLQAADVPFPGHTEILAEKTGIKEYCMVLTSEKITCALVTAHVGYAQVPELLSFERIVAVIELTGRAMFRLRGRMPNLTVCGLNPHAGEHGLFGNREEERIIMPAMEHSRKFGYRLTGPLPPDTAFLPSRLATTDAYICMYHDQGLIPLKTLSFDDAVNVTLGLPIVRTSVDHGTAFDIAWEGKASVTSLIAAFDLAVKLACG